MGEVKDTAARFGQGQQPRQVPVDVVMASAVFRCPCGNPTAMMLPIFNTNDQSTVACGKCQTIFSIDALSFDAKVEPPAPRWKIMLRGNAPAIIKPDLVMPNGVM